MRVWSLIGSIALIVLPFMYVSLKVGDAFSSTSTASLIWITTTGQILGFQDDNTQFFQLEWLQDGGTYNNYFGNFWFVGVFILLLLIVTVILSISTSKNKRKTLPATLLLICGIGLLVLRLILLRDLALSFYDKSNGFVSSTYIEIPIGFLLSLIFSILEFRAD